MPPRVPPVEPHQTNANTQATPMRISHCHQLGWSYQMRKPYASNLGSCWNG